MDAIDVNISTIYQQLLPLYEIHFSVMLSDYSVTNDEEDSRAPITYRKKRSIVLNCNPKCLSQIAFQLSHELCHASIPGGVPASLRWLEETFAILASWIFPPKIPIIDVERYQEYFTRSLAPYPVNCAAHSRKLPAEFLSFIESGSGTSNFNDYGNYNAIGKNMLPSVKTHPTIWKAIPYLCKIPHKMSSVDSYLFWRDILPGDISTVLSVVVGPCFF